MKNLPIIQSLWIGKPLSNMEKLCIQSFLDHGHEFHLYTYADVGKVPKGAVVKDGNEILSADKIFRYKHGSYAGFSNWFRYELLSRKGGVWVDADIVCIKPFDFPYEIVFASEGAAPGLLGTAVLQFPAKHELMLALAKFCAEFKKRDGANFGKVGGPKVLTEFVNKFGMQNYVLPHTFFFPVNTYCWANLYDRLTYQFEPETYAVHFWNTIIIKYFSKDATYESLSLI